MNEYIRVGSPTSMRDVFRPLPHPRQSLPKSPDSSKQTAERSEQELLVLKRPVVLKGSLRGMEAVSVGC